MARKCFSASLVCPDHYPSMHARASSPRSPEWMPLDTGYALPLSHRVKPMAGMRRIVLIAFASLITGIGRVEATSTTNFSDQWVESE